MADNIFKENSIQKYYKKKEERTRREMKDTKTMLLYIAMKFLKC
jgi:hypothetical protein